MHTPQPRRRHLWLLLPVAALIGVAIQLHLTKSAAAPSAAPVRPVPVVLAQARRQNLPIWIDGIGTVTSLNAVNLHARVDGQLQSVHFTEGQHVRAGDLLASIDPRPFQALLAQAQAVQAQEEAKLASIRVDLQRADALAAAGAGPTQTVDTLKAQAATQAATVQGARAATESARLQLSFTRVTAPIAGRVGQQLVPLGSMVHSTDTNGIVTVTQMNPVWVAFSVPQDELPAIREQVAAGPLEVKALAPDARVKIPGGQLVFIDSQITPTNGQVQLKARFDNAAQGLWPGQLVPVRLLLRTQADAVVVPQEAVQQGSKGPFVYVADAQQHAQVRDVQTGPVVAGNQWIRSGLQAGETVVTQGQSRLAAGVAIAGDAAAPAGAATPAGGQP